VKEQVNILRMLEVSVIVCVELAWRSEPVALRLAALPADASAEDVEVDPGLPFLDAFVRRALDGGAAPYIPCELSHPAHKSTLALTLRSQVHTWRTCDQRSDMIAVIDRPHCQCDHDLRRAFTLLVRNCPCGRLTLSQFTCYGTPCSGGEAAAGRRAAVAPRGGDAAHVAELHGLRGAGAAVAARRLCRPGRASAVRRLLGLPR